MKHNKNADTLSFLLSFTKSQREKILKEHSLWVQPHKKDEFGPTLLQYLPNPINKFPAKFIYKLSIFVLLSTGKKAKTTSLKVFKIMAFKNWQQETTEGTLRP